MAGVQEQIDRLFTGPLRELKLPVEPVPELEFLDKQNDAPLRLVPVPHREHPAALHPTQLPENSVLHGQHLFWRNQGQ